MLTRRKLRRYLEKNIDIIATRDEGADYLKIYATIGGVLIELYAIDPPVELFKRMVIDKIMKEL